MPDFDATGVLCEALRCLARGGRATEHLPTGLPELPAGLFLPDADLVYAALRCHDEPRRFAEAFSAFDSSSPEFLPGPDGATARITVTVDPAEVLQSPHGAVRFLWLLVQLRRWVRQASGRWTRLKLRIESRAFLSRVTVESATSAGG